MGEALFWGLAAGAALVLGGVVALLTDCVPTFAWASSRVRRRRFISAVAYELIDLATTVGGGSGRVASGLAVGATLSYLVARRADRLAGSRGGRALPGSSSRWCPRQ